MCFALRNACRCTALLAMHLHFQTYTQQHRDGHTPQAQLMGLHERLVRVQRQRWARSTTYKSCSSRIWGTAASCSDRACSVRTAHRARRRLSRASPNLNTRQQPDLLLIGKKSVADDLEERPR